MSIIPLDSCIAMCMNLELYAVSTKNLTSRLIYIHVQESMYLFFYVEPSLLGSSFYKKNVVLPLIHAIH